MKLLSLLLAASLALLLAGCTSVPNKLLGFDFTAETTPVMLTPIPSAHAQKTQHFVSGVSSTEFSSSRANGGIASFQLSSDIAVALNIQLQNTLSLSPEWLEVSGLSLDMRQESQFFIFSSTSSHKYMLLLGTKVPAQE